MISENEVIAINNYTNQITNGETIVVPEKLVVQIQGLMKTNDLLKTYFTVIESLKRNGYDYDSETDFFKKQIIN